MADFLERLRQAELGGREQRKRQVTTTLAALPGVKTVEQYAFGLASVAPRAHIQELASLAFIERTENIALLGPAGACKTHIATSLAYRAAQAGIETRFINTANLMMQLAAARQQKRLREFFNRAVIGPRLLVIDEIGYLPFRRDEANLFFNAVANRYERGSIVLTSNLPFTQRAPAFADDQTLTAAMLDRLFYITLTSCKSVLNLSNEARDKGRDIQVHGLKGMPEALAAVFPATTLQTCIVYLIRNSLEFASWKDRKGLAAAIRPIYTAPSAEAAEAALGAFSGGPWGQRFPTIGEAGDAPGSGFPILSVSASDVQGGVRDQLHRRCSNRTDLVGATQHHRRIEVCGT